MIASGQKKERINSKNRRETPNSVDTSVDPFVAKPKQGFISSATLFLRNVYFLS